MIDISFFLSFFLLADGDLQICVEEQESSPDGELSDESIDSVITVSSSDNTLSPGSTSDSEGSLFDDNLTVQDLDSRNKNALKILSCFQRHNLTASACRDILRSLKNVSAPDSQTLFDYETLLSFVPSTAYIEIHYCQNCASIFPQTKDVYRCSTRNCAGLRYMGDLTEQQNMKQPMKCFHVADLKKLLINLLKSPGKLFYLDKSSFKVLCIAKRF